MRSKVSDTKIITNNRTFSVPLALISTNNYIFDFIVSPLSACAPDAHPVKCRQRQMQLSSPQSPPKFVHRMNYHTFKLAYL